jgi:hypothetical protein
MKTATRVLGVGISVDEILQQIEEEKYQDITVHFAGPLAQKVVQAHKRIAAEKSQHVFVKELIALGLAHLPKIKKRGKSKT